MEQNVLHVTFSSQVNPKENVKIGILGTSGLQPGNPEVKAEADPNSPPASDEDISIDEVWLPQTLAASGSITSLPIKLLHPN